MNMPNQPPRREKEYEQLSIISVLASGTKVGAATGAAGGLLGSVVGIMRSSTPVTFGVASALQSFGMGTMFWTTRQLVVRQLQQQRGQQQQGQYGQEQPLEAWQRIAASGAGGAAAGAGMGGLVRGRAGVLGSAGGWALACVLGHGAWEAFVTDKPMREEEKKDEEKKSFWERWSPMKKLAPEEYEGMLKDRLLRLDADIALIDEDLRRLRAGQAGQEENRSSK